jgi:hypothetical protein
MKILRAIAIMILFLAVINCWSYVVYLLGAGQYHGPFSHAIKAFAQFPNTVKESLSTIDVAHGKLKTDSYLDMPKGFTAVNRLPYDLFALNTYWSYEDQQWDVRLTDLRTDSILYSWRVDKDSIVLSKVQNLRNLRPKHALLLKGRSVVVNFRQSPNLICLDRTSHVRWVNREMSYHHSMNLDADSNIWVCASHDVPNTANHIDWWNVPTSKVVNIDGSEVKYKDDRIVELDQRTGRILFDRSVSQILIDNGYAGLLFSSVRVNVDPIHLNDIEPALTTTKYWRKGDLFVSMRHLSVVFLYRPETNKVLWLRSGPFLYQHDVDILSDSTISIFNNSYIDNEQAEKYEDEQVDETLYHTTNSQVVTYDFASDTWGTLYDDQLAAEKAFTESEGLSEMLSNGDVYFEEVRNGRVFVLSKQGLLLRKVFPASVAGKIHRPNWMRIYERIPD